MAYTEGRSLLGVLLSSERSVYFFKTFNFRAVFSFLVVMHGRNNCFAVINNPVRRSFLRNTVTALTELKSLIWHCVRANFNDVKNSRMLIKPMKLIKQGQQTRERQTEVLESITEKPCSCVGSSTSGKHSCHDVSLL